MDNPFYIKITQVIIICAGIILPLLAICAFFVPPSRAVFFQWLGLLMPMVLLLNILIVVLCLLLRNIHYSIPLLIFIGLVFYLPYFLQWSFNSVPPDKIDLRIASYNVRDMRSDYGFSTLDKIAEFAEQNQLDVLCMQEVPSEYSEEDLRAAFGGMKSVVFSNEPSAKRGKRLVILSKYPLQRTAVLSAEEDYQYALFVTLSLGNEEVSVVTCHLQTTSWNQVSHSRYYNTTGIYEVISNNYSLREMQALAIRKQLDEIENPLIVTGDFNEAPISYTYHTIGANLVDAFRKAGNGYGYTYRFLNKIFRIDYIFYNNHKFEGYNYRTVNLDYSDHLPVLVDLALKK